MSKQRPKLYRGFVKNQTVVLVDGIDLPDGTPVEVRPSAVARGTLGAVLAAARAEPHLGEDDVAELTTKILEGRKQVRFGSPLD